MIGVMKNSWSMSLAILRMLRMFVGVCMWTNERKEPLLSSFYIYSGTETTHFQSAAVLIKVPEFTIDRGGASVKTVLNHIEEVSEEIRKNEAVLPCSCEDC